MSLARTRAMTSVGPPASNPTTKRIGLLGNSSAACPGRTTAQASAPIRDEHNLIMQRLVRSESLESDTVQEGVVAKPASTGGNVRNLDSIAKPFILAFNKL